MKVKYERSERACWRVVYYSQQLSKELSSTPESCFAIVPSEWSSDAHRLSLGPMYGGVLVRKVLEYQYRLCGGGKSLAIHCVECRMTGSG